MNAIICKKYGPPEGLQIAEIERPVPGENEVLIKIYATSVLHGDIVLRKMTLLRYIFMAPFARLFFGIKNLRKKVLGHEFAGEIAAVGKNVLKFQVGDKVLGVTGVKGGAYAEYISLEETAILTHKPNNISFREAAALPIGGMAAWYFLRKGGVSPGDSVLIYGASGSIGTFAVQLAKYFQLNVTGVCSAKNQQLVKQLGADIVIDYNRSDYTKLSGKYDLIFDTVGKISKSKSKNVLKPNGRFVSTHASPMPEKLEDLVSITDLAEQGVLRTVIDKVYRWQDVVEAHKYVEKGHKVGNVILELAQLKKAENKLE